MYDSWISIIIGLGLILGFYYIRRFRGSNKSNARKINSNKAGIKRPLKKEYRTKLRNHSRSENNPAPSLKPKYVPKTASVLLHPYSLEQAKLHYLANAGTFQGLYEKLYQASQGNMSEEDQLNLVHTLESRLYTIHSEHLELVWRSCVRTENVFRVWLKYLKSWGLQRSVESGRIGWSLNGDVLEQSSQESKKSI
ncbi:hypothetical protein [Desulfitobacterium sp.]|uniref:hypothetical protein n=1 Tax=Desulfitobacterium sp. TaxID=49981 RepID=UPI002B1E9820|nr:hypothetical protein [Desulfitobacterium sp.]MEA4902007.1 hypothetical protein [Desulfitobacterium sp.]